MRRNRLLLLLAPGLAWSNLAFALNITVNDGSGTVLCDADPLSTADCATDSLALALAITNATPGPHTITIDETSYSPPADSDGVPGEYGLPIITEDVTIQTDPTNVASLTDVEALNFTVRTLRVHSATLTVRGLRLRTGCTEAELVEVVTEAPASTTMNGGGVLSSAVDVVEGALVGANLVFEDGGWETCAGSSARPSGWGAVYAEESDVTLAGFSGSGFYNGTFITLDDDQDFTMGGADAHHATLSDCTLSDLDVWEDEVRAAFVYGNRIGSLTITNCTVTDAWAFDGDYWEVRPAVYVERGGDVTVRDTTFDRAWSGGIGQDAHRTFYGGSAGSLLVENTVFTDGEGPAIRFWGANAAVTVRDTSVERNLVYGGEGAVDLRGVDTWFYSDEWYPSYDPSDGIEAVLERVTFTDNASDTGYYGGYNGGYNVGRFEPAGADLVYRGVGSLHVDGMASSGSTGEGFVRSTAVQGVATFMNSSWDIGYGAEGPTDNLYYDLFGRLMLVSPGSDVSLIDSVFIGDTDGSDNNYLHAREGGAIFVAGNDGRRSFLQVRGGTFTDTAAREYGGAIGMSSGVVTDISDTLFEGAYAGEGGAISVGNMESLYYGFIQPPQLYGSNVTFRNTMAARGGALALGPFSIAALTGAAFDGTRADTSTDWDGEYGYYGPEGFGGAVALSMASLELNDTMMTNVSADEWGGAIFSGRGYLSRNRPHYGVGPFGSDCDSYRNGGPQRREGEARSTALGDEAPSDRNVSTFFSSTVVLDGVEIDGAYGEYGGSVAYFGYGDAVAITGTTITGAATNPDVGNQPMPPDNLAEASEFDIAPSEYPLIQGTIFLDSVASFHMSCSTICGAEASGFGAAVFWFDNGMSEDFLGEVIGPQDSLSAKAQSSGSDAFPAKDIRGTIRNNVFQNVDDTAPETGGSVVGLRFCDMQEETNGDVSTNARGRVELVNNTFLDNTATLGHVAMWTGDVNTSLRNNIWMGGEVGLAGAGSSRFLTGEYNQYSGLTTNALELDGFPELTAILADPEFRDYTPGTCGGEYYLNEGTPGYSQGDPSLVDFDDSVSNTGAFGGPGACIPDNDNDGHNAIVDCDDDDPTINPGANEIPYDGIDQNCDGEDLCDVDGDGYLAQNAACGGDDCNDADASINPGATEIANDGIDQNCSGDDLCDLDEDGDGFVSIACAGGNDCDDSDASIYPGAPEVPYDGIDQSCDGADLCDVDCDGFAAPECGGTDCDDNNPAVYPGAPENPFLDYDQNCNGEVPTVWAQGGRGCDTPANTPLGGVWLIGLAAAFARRRRSTEGGE